MNIYICTPLKSEKKFKKRQKEIKITLAKEKKIITFAPRLKTEEFQKGKKENKK